MGVGIPLMWRRPTTPSSNNVSTLRRELDRTRRGYERLFTSVPCFICVLGRDHQILEANELYREEFGATDRSLCYEVCKGRSSKCPECLVDQTFDDGEVYSSEETLITRDGRRINAVVYTRPIYDDDGEISSVMEVFTDITEIKKLQRQLSLMGRAVAGMAHRVKNILMGLEGGIFVVNEGLAAEDQQGISEGWEMVERNVELVSRIVKDLLYCAKERTPNFKPDVCPQEVVLEVKELFADRLASDNIELKTELEEPFHTGNFDRGRSPQPALQSGRKCGRRVPIRPRGRQERPYHYPEVPQERGRYDALPGRGQRTRHLRKHERTRSSRTFSPPRDGGHGHRPVGGPEGRRGSRWQGHIHVETGCRHDLYRGDSDGCEPKRLPVPTPDSAEPVSAVQTISSSALAGTTLS